MEIILLEQVKKLGNVGEVVNVKNGFARNFLIPAKKAIRATKDNVTYFESKKAEINKANDAKSSVADKSAKKIEGKVVALVKQAGEDGRLYGSVTASDIAHVIAAEEIDRKQVILQNPIKYIGVHSIEVSLYGDISATVYVNVARSEGEAEEAAKKFAKGESVMEGPDSSAKKAEEAAAQAEAAQKEAQEKAQEASDASAEEAQQEEVTSDTEEKVA